MFIHFIQVIPEMLNLEVTTYRMNYIKQNPIDIYWSEPFHLVFIEISENKNYYLTFVQNYLQPIDNDY